MLTISKVWFKKGVKDSVGDLFVGFLLRQVKHLQGRETVPSLKPTEHEQRKEMQNKVGIKSEDADSRSTD